MVIKKRKDCFIRPRQVPGKEWLASYLLSVPEIYRADLRNRILYNRVSANLAGREIDALFTWCQTNEDHEFWMYISAGEFRKAYSFIRST